MRKIYFAPDRTWVGEVWVGRYPKDATHEADIPEITDSRWVQGKPTMLDTSVLTLSPFYPSQRLDVCVEYKSSDPLGRYPNHPPFAGAVAWMSLDALRETATPVQNALGESRKMKTEQKYPRLPMFGPNAFHFPNTKRNSREAINAAFNEHGLTAEDVERPWICVTVVMDQLGRLWEHDTSHGGGGIFNLAH